MTNHEVARVLRRIADILQIKDDTPFKIRAYRKAADAIYHLDEDMNVLLKHGRIAEIPGVGRAVQAKIEELLEKGTLSYYERLLEEVPLGVLDMLRVPGLGPRTVRIIHQQLAVTNLDELLQAAQTHQLRDLPGVGVKTEQSIINGIEMLQQNRGKITLGEALPLAEDLLRYLLKSSPVLDGSIVGSVRRGKPLVSDIDILVASRLPDQVLGVITSYPGIRQLVAVEPGHIKGLLSGDIEFEIIIVDPQDYFYALVRTTGSKAHRDIIMAHTEPGQLTGARHESEIYKQLGLPFIPPELRENQGEIEKARQDKLPQLVVSDDLKGDLHIHSNWSDGSEGIADMASAATKLGYKYIAITDHSKSLSISGGLDEERLVEQGKEIDALQPDMELTILKGIEVDILKDGQLDFADEVLEELDVVVASIHSYFKLDQAQQSERIIAAIKNPQVDIIGHISGRLLNRRSGYELDMEEILQAAALNHTALEINANPDRLDIDEEIARRAKAYGVKVAINSDAHHRIDLGLMRYGVMTARRGWLEPEDIINAWDKQKLLDFLK